MACLVTRRLVRLSQTILWRSRGRQGNKGTIQQGMFHLEVAATEVHYEDGSVWLAKDLPGSSDLSKLH